MSNKLGIFGFGYTARFIAKEMLDCGWQVCGTSRSASTRADMLQMGVDAFDFTDADIEGLLSGCTHILMCSPLNKDWNDPVLSRYQAQLTTPPLKWIGYLSTTGVYGDHSGAWVDETTAVRPDNPRLNGRVRAERLWMDLGNTLHIPACVFRLAGIYGEERNAIRQLLDGNVRSIYKKDQVFSRTHVEDIALTLKACMQGNITGIYNVCDDEPAPSHEVIAYAAHLLGVPAPELVAFEQANLSDMAREFYSSNRRVSNRKYHTLGIDLRYPTYRDGLRTLLETERLQANKI